MTRTPISTTALLALSLLAGCAQSPGSVVPVSMGNAYDNVSCAQAAQILNEERPKLAVLMQKQKEARTGDAIGVFLVLIPVSSLTGNDVAGELATSKGKVNALEARLVSCG